MNVVTISGRLTRDPEIRYTQTQEAIAGISVAVNRRYRREGQPEADFFNCTAFGKTAEVVERYTRKGSRVIITGALQNDIYTNREGIKVTATKVIVNQIDFVDTKTEASAQSVPSQPAYSQNGFMAIPDDVDDGELPFN